MKKTVKNYGEMYIAKLAHPIEKLDEINIGEDAQSCDVKHPSNLSIQVDCDFTTKDENAKILGLCI